jgi:hypothetical protein
MVVESVEADVVTVGAGGLSVEVVEVVGTDETLLELESLELQLHKHMSATNATPVAHITRSIVLLSYQR